MAKYRTAMGKSIDMSALAARNEKTRAVGNMGVNARGDTIDAFGKVIVSATKKVGDGYQKTVGNKTANATRTPSRKLVEDPIKKPISEDLTAAERELEEAMEDDLAVEAIKAKEQGKQ